MEDRHEQATAWDSSSNAVATPTASEGRGESPMPALDIATVFRTHNAYVSGVAIRILGRDADVDDVVQEVFLRAHRGLSSLRDPSAIRPWLVTLTLRVARRKIRLRRFKSFLGFDDATGTSEIASPDASEDDRVLLATVYQSLDRVPANHRIAWILRYIEGHELERVAELCECSLATVKRWIASAQAVVTEAADEQ